MYNFVDKPDTKVQKMQFIVPMQTKPGSYANFYGPP